MRFCIIVISFIVSLSSYANAVTLTKILEEANQYTVKIQNSIEKPYVEDGYAGRGTGFLVDKANGLILTNAHVSGSSPAINEINFKNRKPVSAKQVYIDPELDLAIIKVDPSLIPKNAKEAHLECSGNYQQGEDVVAFGHPYSKDFTLTRGIISSIRYEKLAMFESIQTDAPINPGNSGGPLINISTGKIIGISSFGLKNTQGLNFALPSHHICTILKLFQEGKDPSPLNFNVLFASNDNLGSYLKVSMILSKKNILKPGDIIIKANGVVVKNPTALVTATRGNNVVKLEVVREGKIKKLSTTLQPKGSLTKRVGIVVSDALIANKFTATYSGVSEEVYNPNHNLVVQSVEAGIAKGVLKERDIIISIDGKMIADVIELEKYLKDKKSVELILRSVSNFNNKSIFYDRFETLKIEDVQLLKFN